MTYDEEEKQAAPVENLLAPHSQGKSGEATTSEEGYVASGREPDPNGKFTKRNPTSRSHLLLKGTRICHP